MPEILRPDAGKVLYLLIGVLVVPRVLPMLRGGMRRPAPAAA